MKQRLAVALMLRTPHWLWNRLPERTRHAAVDAWLRSIVKPELWHW